MDNFFELLPFIIGILYFVFGRNKKTKESPKTPSNRKPKTSTRPSLEEVLRELTGDIVPEEKPKAVPVQEYIPEEPKAIAKEEVFEDPIDHHADTGKSLAEIKQKIREEKVQRGFEVH